MTIALSLDQLVRPQPGGIATYVRGLVGGLAALGRDDVVGLAPSGSPLADLGIAVRRLPVRRELLTTAWRYHAIGVPRTAAVVHATSMAGPFGGGRAGAVHSVALHDLLWRDEPDATTARGRRFHERRLALLARHGELRIFTSSPGLDDRLVEVGFDRSRLHPVRLGVDDGVTPAPPTDVANLLERAGVIGAFTLYAGTREPRKNLARLAQAHSIARAHDAALGPLVVVGPSGWGDVDLSGAVVLGPVERRLLRGLLRDATVVAYVPLHEGWGLPPVEALTEGSRVVASTTTPSVASNAEVERADALDVDGIASALLRALARSTSPEARARRRASVAALTWRQCALDHLAGWRCE